MTVYDKTVNKIRALPEPLLNEVNDFVDFLLQKKDYKNIQVQKDIIESLDTAKSGFSDYLQNLEEYETKLVNGEIKW